MFPHYLKVLNSATKFPEIKTYHVMGDKGKLQPELSVPIAHDELFYASEKVDGANVRIIINVGCYCDWFIGSREELLFAKGDRIYNKQMGIVPAMIPIAEKVATKLHNSTNTKYGIYTIFGELYGGKMPAKKQYTERGAFEFRVFDIQFIPAEEYNELLTKEKDEVAQWRNAGGQTFLSLEDKAVMCCKLGLKQTPFINLFWGIDLPEGVPETYEFLQKYKTTMAGIDCVGKSEGIVIRNNNRSAILKLRFEDYENALGLKQKSKHK